MMVDKVLGRVSLFQGGFREGLGRVRLPNFLILTRNREGREGLCTVFAYTRARAHVAIVGKTLPTLPTLPESVMSSMRGARPMSGVGR